MLICSEGIVHGRDLLDHLPHADLRERDSPRWERRARSDGRDSSTTAAAAIDGKPGTVRRIPEESMHGNVKREDWDAGAGVEMYCNHY